MRQIGWIIAGAGALLAVKYVIVGLDAWNDTLHPGRFEDQSLSRFAKPFLGVFSK